MHIPVAQKVYISFLFGYEDKELAFVVKFKYRTVQPKMDYHRKGNYSSSQKCFHTFFEISSVVLNIKMKCIQI